MKKVLKINAQSLSALYFFIKPYWLYITGIIISLSLAAATLLSFGIGIQFLIDRGFTTQDQAFLNQAVLILMGMSIVMALSSFCRYYLSAALSESALRDLKAAVFSKLLSLTPSFFEDFRVGEILARLNADTALLRIALGSYLSTGLRSLLQCIGGIILLFYTSPKLTGFVFIIIPFIILPIFYMGKKVKKLGRQAQDGLGREGACIEETFNAIRTVQSYCREPLHFKIFAHSLDQTLELAKNYIWRRAWMVAYIILVVFIAISFLLWFGGSEVIKGHLTAGELSSFLFFGVILATSINTVLELFSDIQRALGASDRLFELLKTRSKIMNAPKVYPLPLRAKGSLILQDISFCYPSRPHKLSLEKIYLSIKAGEKIAIVGPSGAGKSTLFNLILRFYDPQSGGIALDNIDIKMLSLETLRSNIGIVPQDPFIFNASVYDNIAYGRMGATSGEVHKAADMAFASEFIHALPQRYDTLLGEKGVRLSGGQKQRLAIARALLKDPLVLLLDEATNALDAHSEFMALKALEKGVTNRTTLIVAHRLSTIQSADRIIVLNEGKIVSTGTHHKLLQEDGLYQKLAKLQFGNA